MYRLFIKRFLDIVLSGIALIILSPLYIIVGIYVLATMGWPLLFKQVRTGLDGKPFTMYKFRTMTNKKDKNGELLPEKERLTKGGIALRSSSLDELPEEPYYYKEELRRHTVRGGLLPPDSLSGETTPTWEKQLEFDTYYADHLSFWLDCKVLWITFKILFKRTQEDYGNCERPHLSEYRKSLINEGGSLNNISINNSK